MTTEVGPNSGSTTTVRSRSRRRRLATPVRPSLHAIAASSSSSRRVALVRVARPNASSAPPATISRPSDGSPSPRSDGTTASGVSAIRPRSAIAASYTTGWGTCSASWAAVASAPGGSGSVARAARTEGETSTPRRPNWSRMALPCTSTVCSRRYASSTSRSTSTSTSTTVSSSVRSSASSRAASVANSDTTSGRSPVVVSAALADAAGTIVAAMTVAARRARRGFITIFTPEHRRVRGSS